MMKTQLQRFVRKYGYEIRKAPYPEFRPVPLFDLALHYMISSRGEKQTFIEVGANDGISVDPLRPYILKYPWSGVMVEPQPDVFERLLVNCEVFGPRVKFENVAISSSPEPITMYRAPKAVSDIGSATQVSADAKITARQLGMKASDLDKITVPTARLDDLVAKYELNDLSLVQLDTEGFDWDVLQTLDLTKTRPLMIGFEHGHLSPVSIGDMTAHLNSHGYDVHYGGYENDSMALREDFIVE